MTFLGGISFTQTRKGIGYNRLSLYCLNKCLAANTLLKRTTSMQVRLTTSYTCRIIRIPYCGQVENNRAMTRIAAGPYSCYVLRATASLGSVSAIDPALPPPGNSAQRWMYAPEWRRGVKLGCQASGTPPRTFSGVSTEALRIFRRRLSVISVRPRTKHLSRRLIGQQ
jgi:hypothetical protein